MYSFARWFLVIACLASGVPAEAGIYTVNPVDGYDCAGDMSTADCFSGPTGTAFNGPTPTACTAEKSRNQACRECAPAYDDQGQWKGYAVCAYVPWSSACTCENARTANCADKGTCTYK